jgi:hypothetical protein
MQVLLEAAVQAADIRTPYGIAGQFTGRLSPAVQETAAGVCARLRQTLLVNPKKRGKAVLHTTVEE